MDRRGSNSVVESQPSKLLVAGSIPVSRSISVASFQSPVSSTRAGQPAVRYGVDLDAATDWNRQLVIGNGQLVTGNW